MPATVKKNENGEQVFLVNLPEDDEESSELWNGFKKNMILNKNSPAVDDSKSSGATLKEDNCKEFRTKVILSWLASNAILVIIF